MERSEALKVIQQCIETLLNCPGQKKTTFSLDDFEVKAYWVGSLLRIDVKGVKESE